MDKSGLKDTALFCCMAAIKKWAGTGQKIKEAPFLPMNEEEAEFFF